MRVVGIGAVVRGDQFPVEGRAQQARGEGAVSQRPAVALVDHAVAIGIGEEIGVAVRVVDHRHANHLARIGQHRLHQPRRQPVDVGMDADRKPAAAVMAAPRDADVAGIAVFVAGQAGVGRDLQRMRLVARDAGRHRAGVEEAAGIILARVVVARGAEPAEPGGCGGGVMRVDEGKLRVGRVGVAVAHRIGDGDACGAALVAGGAGRLDPGDGMHHAAGQPHLAHLGQAGAVAGLAIDHAADGHRVFRQARRAAVKPVEGAEARAGMAGGADGRDRALGIPMGEGGRLRVGMARPRPGHDRGIVGDGDFLGMEGAALGYDIWSQRLVFGRRGGRFGRVGLALLCNAVFRLSKKEDPGKKQQCQGDSDGWTAHGGYPVAGFSGSGC